MINNSYKRQPRYYMFLTWDRKMQNVAGFNMFASIKYKIKKIMSQCRTKPDDKTNMFEKRPFKTHNWPMF